MKERRFDDLTRFLGAARSRRKVFKAALGGVVVVLLGRVVGPAVAGTSSSEVCSRAACITKAGKLFVICNHACSQLSGRHGYGHEEGFGRAPAGKCCQPKYLMKYAAVDSETDQCLCNVGGFGIYCAGNLPPGDDLCSCGPWLT